KKRGIPVIAGGAGFSFIPEGILRYLGADWGVYGPGERVLVTLLDSLEQNPPRVGTVFDGWEAGFDPDIDHQRAPVIDYGRYTANRGLLGFETQKGCHESCSFCSEGNKRVLFKKPEKIVQELRELARQGFTDFHLCDSEFNQNLDHCKAFLGNLIGRGPEFLWAVYMKVAPYDDELFSLLRKSGVQLITLSVPTGQNSFEHARETGRLSKKHGIKLAVDFLCGFPGDTVQSVKESLENLRRIEPATVGINTYFRLGPKLPVTKRILASPEYTQHLLGALPEENPDYVKPVFYNHITVEMLRDMVGDDPLFKIEGFEQTSNYERIRTGGVQ
ncbi:radical SAM protein, partial [bacterium]|nr:radical SAM protein [bacterium]